MNNLKFICLVVIFLACHANKMIKFDFVDQILPSKESFFTIEACEKGCSWFYLRKYDKKGRLIQELQWQNHVKLLKYSNDTLTVILYLPTKVGESPTFNETDSIIKWGNEYVKYERVGISGYGQGEKDVIINKFNLTNDSLFINADSSRLIFIPVNEVMGSATYRYFTQKNIGEILYSTNIEFSNMKVKEQFVKAIEEYRKLLFTRN